MTLVGGSLFSGIGCFDLALVAAGGQVAFQVEKDRACRELLARWFPDTPNYGDMQDVDWFSNNRPLPSVSLLFGGFPCQDLSVAGKRAGLAGDRSGLWWLFAAALLAVRPRWVFIENVPGLLSSNAGRDMGAILSTLDDLGYGVAWRVLDAQYFGVAQRRRRVFIVGGLGDPAGAASVLFESESLSGDSPPRRTTGEDVAGTLGVGTGSRGWSPDTDRMSFIPGVAYPVGTKWHGNENSGVHPPAVAFTERTRKDGRNLETQDELAYALTNPGSGGRTHSRQLLQGTAVRRLTPLECERLQGLPEGWTAGFSDSIRYRMLGNSGAEPCVEWIFRRMVEVDRRMDEGKGTM